ncbi:hypothetical protein [Pontibacter sp. H249]|uniref:hypothetical protein n=1 Tax=Pontibacter sp. H249 TaxID=3133420 RepID=UPI0030C1BA63
MKTLSFTFILFLFSAAGFAQAPQEPLKHLPPIKKKPLNLKYLGNDSGSVMERLKDVPPKANSTLRPSSIIKGEEKNTQALALSMPIVKANPEVNLPILVAKPDSTIHYYLQIKKP